MIKFEEYIVEHYVFDGDSSCYRLNYIDCNHKDLNSAKCSCTSLKFFKEMKHPPKFVIYKREVIRDDFEEEFNGYID